MLAFCTLRIRSKLNGRTQMGVNSRVDVSGKIICTGLSIHLDVQIKLAVALHWRPHGTSWQP